MSENQQTADLAAKLERMAEAFTAAPHHVRLKRSDGELVQSAVATIETLRRRVAELEGEKASANRREAQLELIATFIQDYHPIGEVKAIGLLEAFQAVKEVVESLTTENTELNRQVVALREDAEVGRLVRELLTTRDHGGFWIERTLTGRYVVLMQAGEICRGGDSLLEALLEALREAAKGEVE